MRSRSPVPIVPDGLVPGDSFHLLLVTQPVQALRTKVQDYADVSLVTQCLHLPGSNDLAGVIGNSSMLSQALVISTPESTRTPRTPTKTRECPFTGLEAARPRMITRTFYDGDWDDESARNARGELVALPDGVWTGSTADGRELMDGGTSRALGREHGGLRRSRLHHHRRRPLLQRVHCRQHRK